MKDTIAPNSGVFKKGAKGVSGQIKCVECGNIRKLSRMMVPDAIFDGAIVKCKICCRDTVHKPVLDISFASV